MKMTKLEKWVWTGVLIGGLLGAIGIAKFAPKLSNKSLYDFKQEETINTNNYNLDKESKDRYHHSRW